MISDKRLAEIEAAISRVAEAAHSDSLPDCCAGCVAELALADLLAVLRAERERVAALEGALERWAKARDRTNACHDEFGWGQEGYEACSEWRDAEDTAAEALLSLAALTPDPEQA